MPRSSAVVSGLALLQQLAVLPLARSQPSMGEPLSEILMVSDDNEFHEAVHGPSRRGTTDYRSSASCWAVLFVNGEEEQLPSISLLEVRVVSICYYLCIRVRLRAYVSRVTSMRILRRNGRESLYACVVQWSILVFTFVVWSAGALHLP